TTTTWACSPGAATGWPWARTARPTRPMPDWTPSPWPQDRPAVLHRRRQRDAAGVQHRGSRLRQLLRGEPAGHPQGRELRLGGHSPRHAGQGLAEPPAHLAVRRARRLLRPRGAAPGAAAGRHRGTQRPVYAGLAQGLPAAVLWYLCLRDRGG